MAKRTIQFRIDETKELYKLLSGLASRGHDLGRVFDDFLTALVCALASQRRYRKGYKQRDIVMKRLPLDERKLTAMPIVRSCGVMRRSRQPSE